MRIREIRWLKWACVEERYLQFVPKILWFLSLSIPLLLHYNTMATHRIALDFINIFRNVEFYVNVCVTNNMACETVISVQRSQTKYYRLAHRTSNYTTTQHTHTCWRIVEVNYKFSNLFTKVNLNKLNFVRIDCIEFLVWLHYNMYLLLPIATTGPKITLVWTEGLICTFVCVCLFCVIPARLLPHSFIKLCTTVRVNTHSIKK